MTLRACLSAAAVTGAAVLLSDIAYAAPRVSEPAPAFAGVTSAGGTLNLEDLAGRTVVLEWTNDGCPFVQKHYGGGAMQAAQRSVAAAGGVWISVISSAPGKQGHADGPAAEAIAARNEAAPDYILLDPDGVIGRAYAAKTTPHMFVIDGDGVLRYDGAIDDRPSASPASLDGARNYVLEAVAAVEAGAAVDPARTTPYGCSVKYAD